MTTDPPAVTPTRYTAAEPNFAARAFLADVMEAVERGGVSLVDVRTPEEFTGEILAPPGLPETCQRGGHIPSAKSFPWEVACRKDGTFKPPEELARIYAAQGVTRDRPAVTYCRVGERSSHTWFALKYLVGIPDVRNYDGSWTEWGNLVRAPIEW